MRLLTANYSARGVVPLVAGRCTPAAIGALSGIFFVNGFHWIVSHWQKHEWSPTLTFSGFWRLSSPPAATFHSGQNFTIITSDNTEGKLTLTRFPTGTRKPLPLPAKPDNTHDPNIYIMSMSIEDSAAGRNGFPRPIPNTPSNVVEQFKMSGKVVVVNGAADGIGYAVAEGMAEAGAAVVLLYNS